MSLTPLSIVPSGFRGVIGAARQDITPPIGIYARNWGAAEHQTADGVHRPLILTCLTFQAQRDSPPLVLIAADLGWWRNREDEWALRSAILEAFRLDEARLMFCLAHTHAGPGLQRSDADRPGGHLIGPYLDHLRDSAIRAVGAALTSACPATLTWRYGRCDLAVNRDLPEPGQGKRIVVGFNPCLIADDTLLVGRITQDGSDRTLATIVNYACHPTTLAWENRLISPDYVGAMRERVESATAAPCLFLQGASGELAPAEQYTADVTLADRHGRRLGHAVLATLQAMHRPGKALAFDRVVESGAALAVWREVPVQIPCEIAAQMQQVEFRLKPLPPMEHIQRQWRDTNDPVHKERLARQLGVRRCVGDAAVTHMPLWVWRLGDSLLFGQPNEAYSKFQ
ncbi:MAG TPA: hypothetical protein VNL70_08390, partial [Tepidisphaeraceae bacterium]|nr:hypothetical protein [Tepidisphaeraceae bacterium]